MKSFDAASLAALPNDLRRQVLEAIDEAEAAAQSGDTARIEKAAATAEALTKQVQEHNAATGVHQVFRARKAVSGTNNVMREFAERAGVKS